MSYNKYGKVMNKGINNMKKEFCKNSVKNNVIIIKKKIYIYILNERIGYIYVLFKGYKNQKAILK